MRPGSSPSSRTKNRGTLTTGTRTDNAAMKERYWTVFTPDAFAQIPLPLSMRVVHVLGTLRARFSRK